MCMVSFISYYALWTCSHANDINEQLHSANQMVTCGNRDEMETIEVIAYKVGKHYQYSTLFLLIPSERLIISIRAHLTERINLKGTARNFQQNSTSAYSKIRKGSDWMCAGELGGNSEEAYVKLGWLEIRG